MGRIFAITFFICFITIPFQAASFEANKFPQSFHIEKLDITVSEAELGAEGPYPLIGANVLVKRGEKTVLDETFEIDGYLRGAWVADMDRDHNPEIILWVRMHGSGGYGSFSLYEIAEQNLSRHDFPALTEEQKKGYMGHDQLTTTPSNVIRRYQTYRESDPNCCPTGDVVELIYRYEGDQLALERFGRLD